MASTRGEWPSVVGYSRISRGRILWEREESMGEGERKSEATDVFRWTTITHFRDSSRHLVAPSVMVRWNGEEPAKSGAVMYAPGGREGETRKEEGGREGGRK